MPHSFWQIEIVNRCMAYRAREGRAYECAYCGHMEQVTLTDWHWASGKKYGHQLDHTNQCVSAHYYITDTLKWTETRAGWKCYACRKWRDIP